MAIKLGSDLEAHLLMQIAEGLQGTILNHDYINITSLSWIDPIHESLPDEIRLKLDRFCGDSGLKSFIRHEIHADLSSHDGQTVPRRALVSLPPFNNTIPYARLLLDRLKALPIRLRLTVALPASLSDPIIGDMPDKVRLGTEMEIVNGDNLPQPFTLSSNIPRVDRYLFRDPIYGDAQDRELKPDRLYITTPILGYATHNSAGSISRLFEDYIKAFYGAGLADGIFQLEFNWEDNEKLPFITIHRENSDRTLLATEKLEQELVDAEDRMSTAAFAEANQGNVWLAAQSALSRISTLFRSDKESRKLFTACVWYYRAMLNKRPLDTLLEATIAIEVLLGDRQASEGVGLANLLGNRCAFLLGNNSMQRDNILRLFPKIYKLRSDIVHEGRHKLEPGEGKTVSSAVSLCGAIISREMDIRSTTNE
ncbi:hypothetical protein [Sphingomonas koreensis]